MIAVSPFADEDKRLFAGSDCAIAYQISSNLLACLYWPDSDFRLPISVTADNGWRLATWSIQAPEEGGQLRYLIILNTISACDSPKRIVVTSHFGAKTLEVNDPLPIGEACIDVRNRCAMACIRALATRKIVEDEELLAILGPLMALPARIGVLSCVNVRGARSISGEFKFLPSALFVQEGNNLTRLTINSVQVAMNNVVNIDITDRYKFLLRSGAVVLAVSAAGAVDAFDVEAVLQ